MAKRCTAKSLCRPRKRLLAGEAATAGNYNIHPALLDAALHVLAAAADRDASEEALLLPFAWSNVALHARGATELRVRLDMTTTAHASQDVAQVSASLVVWDGTGQPVATVGALELRRATAEQVRAAVQADGRDLYRVSWQPVVLAESPVATDKVLVVGGTGRLSAALGVGRRGAGSASERVAALDALLDVSLEPAVGRARRARSALTRACLPRASGSRDVSLVVALDGLEAARQHVEAQRSGRVCDSGFRANSPTT